MVHLDPAGMTSASCLHFNSVGLLSIWFGCASVGFTGVHFNVSKWILDASGGFAFCHFCPIFNWIDLVRLRLTWWFQLHSQSPVLNSCQLASLGYTWPPVVLLVLFCFTWLYFGSIIWLKPVGSNQLISLGSLAQLGQLASCCCTCSRFGRNDST